MKMFALAARLILATVLSLGLAAHAFAQQPYPSKPIRLIVPFPPGGSTTPVARLVGQKLTERLGQPVIVDNKPGGNGVIGSEELVRAAPDGYTLLLVVNTHAINAAVMKSLPYHSVSDFAPVGTLFNIELVLVTNPALPASNLREFIALAKAKPSAINVAAGDNGGLTHLAAENLNITAGTKLQVVSYKGSGPALTDTIAGHVQAYFSSVGAALEHIKGGKLNALAISGKQHNPALPNVPTFAEGGLPGFEANSWCGILAPAGTPKPILDKLSSELTAILALPDVRESLLKQGLDPLVSTPEQFGAMIKSDIGKFERVIKTANIKFE